MWGAAGDGIATALRLRVERVERVERPEDLLDTAERLLAAAPASWGRHGFDRTATGAHRVRTSCCLWYRLPDTSACTTCPRTAGPALELQPGEAARQELSSSACRPNISVCSSGSSWS